MESKTARTTQREQSSLGLANRFDRVRHALESASVATSKLRRARMMTAEITVK